MIRAGGAGAKKRKHDGHLDDIERSLYSSFSSAANGISSLYTQALNQQRKAYCLGSRAMAEKVMGWLEDEHDQMVSASVLVALLRREVEDLDGHAAQLATADGAPTSVPHQQAPAPHQPSQPQASHAPAGSTTSPGGGVRRFSQEGQKVRRPLSERQTASPFSAVSQQQQQQQYVQGQQQGSVVGGQINHGMASHSMEQLNVQHHHTLPPSPCPMDRGF